MTDLAWSPTASTISALDHAGIVRATTSGRKMSETLPCPEPRRSASGVSGQTPPLATNTADSTATAAAAAATVRSRRPMSPLTTSQKIEASSIAKIVVCTDFTTATATG